VIGERVTVVRWHGGENELVSEHEQNDEEEERRNRVEDDLAHRRAGRRKGYPPPAAKPPARERAYEEYALGNREAAPCHLAKRRQRKRHEPKVRDEGEV
jgi:hypothetical protein